MGLREGAGRAWPALRTCRLASRPAAAWHPESAPRRKQSAACAAHPAVTNCDNHRPSRRRNAEAGESATAWNHEGTQQPATHSQRDPLTRNEQVVRSNRIVGSTSLPRPNWQHDPRTAQATKSPAGRPFACARRALSAWPAPLARESDRRLQLSSAIPGNSESPPRCHPSRCDVVVT